jgi:putative cell wall-binding protein
VAALLLGVPSTALGITRAAILDRASYWVELPVPYSQTSYFQGYRTDCSGMASMAWRLDQSYSTRTLAASGYLVPVEREDLQPGDMLLKYDYHAAIFYKWANAEHTWYWTLEQSGGTGHATSRLTPYPFWGVGGFRAFRHRGIQEVNDYGPYIEQVAGPDRYATAIAASRLAFASGEASRAVICSGETWPDALGGSALAGSLQAPILLVARDRMPAGLDDELLRLGVQHAYVIGGEAAVSSSVARSIDGVPGVTVTRIGGADRFETASLVARQVVDVRVQAGLPTTSTVYVATGRSFPDALGAASIAACTGRPILLSEPGLLPDSTASALESIEASRALIAGGPAALESTITAQLERAGLTETVRFAGVDRYETSFMLAREGEECGIGWSDPALATGQDFADALAGAAMQAHRGSGLMLTRPDRLSLGGDWAVREHLDAIDKVTVLGGVAAVGATPRRQVRWIMDEPPDVVDPFPY